MDAHVANAQAVAEWLEADPRCRVGALRRPAVDPTTAGARYLPEGPGRGVRLRGARRPGAGERSSRRVELVSHLANIGDTRTLVIHPGSTTHHQLTDEQLEAAGVGADLVRISVGIEDVDDIIWDLDQGDQAENRANGSRVPGLAPRARATASCGIPAAWRSSGSANPSRRQLLRGHLPDVVQRLRDVYLVNPDSEATSAGRSTRRWPTCRWCPTWSTCSAARRPAVGARRRHRGRREDGSGCSSGCGEPGGPHGDGGRPAGGDGPLPEDRARPLPRGLHWRASTPA